MTTLFDETVITRKPCICFGCAREMPKGSKIRKLTAKEDGEFIRTNWCKVCEEYFYAHGLTEDDQFERGALKENDPEGWEECRQEVEGK